MLLCRSLWPKKSYPLCVPEQMGAMQKYSEDYARTRRSILCSTLPCRNRPGVRTGARSSRDRNRPRIPLDTVTPDSTFEQLGIDSLDRINLLFDLENEFDISIDDEQARSIENIPQMVAGIEGMLRAKAGGT